MTQQHQYLRYLEQAKQAELADQLRRDGYTVQMDEQVEGQSFDLVARKQDEALAYEIRAAGSRRVTKDVMRNLLRSAKIAGLEFRILIVNPPARVNVEIPQLSSDLLNYVINESFPDELNSLSTHTRVENVVDVDISNLRIDSSGVHVEGTGTIEVSLQYGTGSDSSDTSDAFPFTFEASLDLSGSLQAVNHFAVDTSSFEE